jgi:D-amino-acid dehydrogenase
MEKRVDVIIIGGGAIGLCCAYFLHKKGRSVTIVDRGNPELASSSKNAGLIVPSHFIPLAAPGVIRKGIKWMFSPESPFYIKPRLSSDLNSWLLKFRNACSEKQMRHSMIILRDLTATSKNLYAEITKLENMDFGFEGKGLIMLHNTREGEEENLKMAELASEIDIEAQWVGIDEIQQLEPKLKIKASGGIYFPQDAHLDPFKFLVEMKSFLQKNGVVFEDGLEVTKLTSTNGRITQLQTSSKIFTAGEIVIAGGAWSPQLLQNINLRILLEPAKGYSITFDNLVKRPQIPFLLTEAKVAVTPIGDSLRFAGTLELAGLDSTINQRRVDAILKAVPRYFSSIDVAELQSEKGNVWAGFRPCSPDGLPYIGRFNAIKNLTIATGHAMLGMTLAPVTGKLISEVIVENLSSFDLNPLNPERFFN